MDPEPKVLFSGFFTLPLILLTVASFIFTIATIFLYKNRLLQIRICAFNVLTNIVLIMVIFFFFDFLFNFPFKPADITYKAVGLRSTGTDSLAWGSE